MPEEKKKPGSASSKKKAKDVENPVLAGVYIFPNGDRYEGEYKKIDGAGLMRSGYGTHTTSDGVVYTGQWEADKMTGKGRLEFPNECVYEGDFVNNQFDGRGTYTWPNGSFYSGQFAGNKMEGEGEFTDTDGQVWTGTFRYKAAPGLRFKLNL